MSSRPTSPSTWWAYRTAVPKPAPARPIRTATVTRTTFAHRFKAPPSSRAPPPEAVLSRPIGLRRNPVSRDRRRQPGVLGERRKNDKTQPDVRVASGKGSPADRMRPPDPDEAAAHDHEAAAEQGQAPPPRLGPPARCPAVARSEPDAVGPDHPGGDHHCEQQQRQSGVDA